jgi:HD-GYP domain-containing protein (c-di-GMP phosphodiesterase class II)
MMNAEEPTFQLDVAVCSLEGPDLLPAGTVVTPEVVAGIVAAGQRRTWPFRSLLEHGTVRRDLARAAREGHYRTVFGSDEEFHDLEGLMVTVQLPEPCLRGMDWFRQHDFPTYRHILMVFALSCLLAHRTGLDGAATRAEILAGPLHDFGKLCVPLPVLQKSSPLARRERSLLEQHTLAGHLILSYYFQNPETFTTRVARDHHERRDGSGYPRGIKLADRLVEIVAACDVYDALISPRPYRQSSYDNRSALEELTEMATAGRLDMEVVRLLVAFNRRDKPAPERCDVSLEKRGHAPAGNFYGVTRD